MSFLESLPPDAVLVDVFRRFPRTARPLLEYHEALLRGPSPLSIAERELIAAFVSALNDCAYCRGVHEATARAFGIEGGVLSQLLADVDRAPVPARLRPLLRYVRTLTTTPTRLTQDDADAVFAAGWDEQALHDAVSITGLFNFMNRLVNGLGIVAGEDYFELASGRLREGGYSGLIELLGE